MTMQIRPPATFLDANGNPAADFKVYISEMNSDPKDESKHLVITDSATGDVVSNPFVITADGYPRNADGQVVSPVIQEDAYAVLFQSIGGGQQYSYPAITSDLFGIPEPSLPMVDKTLNTLQDALSEDMTGFNFIFVQSETGSWEGTANGPVDSFYSYYTGGQGTPGTGDSDLFYDAGGNEWKVSVFKIETENAANISSNAGNITTNAVNIASNETNITNLTDVVLINAVKIADNTTDIGTNTTDISTNASDITTLEDGVVYKTGAQTITGSKTFTSAVAVADGVADGDAINKGQLDILYVSQYNSAGTLLAGTIPSGWSLIKGSGDGNYELTFTGGTAPWISATPLTGAVTCAVALVDIDTRAIKFYDSNGVLTDSDFYLGIREF